MCSENSLRLPFKVKFVDQMGEKGWDSKSPRNLTQRIQGD